MTQKGTNIKHNPLHSALVTDYVLVILNTSFLLNTFCLFNLSAEYIIWNARLDEAQAGIKIAGRNLNNLRYADDTSLMAESEEEPKSMVMQVKEKVKSWLKTQHSKN